MRTCQYIIVLGLSLLVNTICAQDSLRRSTFSVSLGASSLANKDEFQSPYTYRGTNFTFNANYRNYRPKGHHVVDVTSSFGKIESIVSPRANNNLLLINYDYLFNVTRPNRKFTAALGGGVHTLISTTNYLPNIEEPKTYLSGGVFLNVGGEFTYRLNRKSYLQLQVGVPVVGIVYRPDFEINGGSLNKVAAIGKANLFSLKLEYTYKISPRMGISLSYIYNKFSFDEPRSINVMQNGLMLGIKKAF